MQSIAMKTILIFISILASVIFKIKPKDDSNAISAQIDGVVYKVILKKSQSLSIYKMNDKVWQHQREIYLDTDEGSISDIKFIDFNEDGFKDIVINYNTNVPDICDMFLYHAYTKNFIKVEDFSKYPASIKLPYVNLYYSYHRSGCADSNWDSDLFKIVNFKTIKIGNISGQKCVDPPDKEGIYIYKVNGRKKNLVKTFTIEEPYKYKETKWGFIADYWKHNYREFK